MRLQISTFDELQSMGTVLGTIRPMPAFVHSAAGLQCLVTGQFHVSVFVEAPGKAGLQVERMRVKTRPELPIRVSTLDRLLAVDCLPPSLRGS